MERRVAHSARSALAGRLRGAADAPGGNVPNVAVGSLGELARWRNASAVVNTNTRNS